MLSTETVMCAKPNSRTAPAIRTGWIPTASLLRTCGRLGFAGTHASTNASSATLLSACRLLCCSQGHTSIRGERHYCSPRLVRCQINPRLSDTSKVKGIAARKSRLTGRPGVGLDRTAPLPNNGHRSVVWNYKLGAICRPRSTHTLWSRACTVVVPFSESRSVPLPRRLR